MLTVRIWLLSIALAIAMSAGALLDGPSETDAAARTAANVADAQADARTAVALNRIRNRSPR